MGGGRRGTSPKNKRKPEPNKPDKQSSRKIVTRQLYVNNIPMICNYL